MDIYVVKKDENGDYYWVNQVGSALITKAGGNGCARDCWTISRNVNAGNDFTLVYDKYDLRVGDWVIFSGGDYGHIGIVKSVVKAGSLIELQGENQGSIKVNIVRRSLNDFLGAFRYKGWHNAIPKKSNEEIAKEVIAGKWGNGEDRKNRLKNAGYDYFITLEFEGHEEPRMACEWGLNTLKAICEKLEW